MKFKHNQHKTLIDFIKINSTRLVSELKTFIWHNGRAEAMRSYNDDLVMSACIGIWVRDTALRLRQEGIDLTKRTLGGISSNLEYAGVYGQTDMKDNPWKMKIGEDIEDYKGTSINWKCCNFTFVHCKSIQRNFIA